MNDIMTRQNQYFPQSRPHPGETLAEKLEEMEMGPKEFALRTGKPEKTIIAVMKGDEVYSQWKDINDCPPPIVQRLKHYFLTYKNMHGQYHHTGIVYHVGIIGRGDNPLCLEAIQ